MHDLKVTIVQLDQVWENVEANKNNVLKKINNIVETDLIVLPEMLFTGFSMNTNLAEDCSNSTSLTFLINLALEKNVAIYTSLMVKENALFYNRGVFIFPNGEVKFYDKRKLFTLAKEENYFTSGKNETIISYKDWNINLQICYDLRFPEISRNLLNENEQAKYDLSLYVANWPQRRAHHWKSLLIARAIENQAFVIGSNRVGTDGNGLEYSGDSCAIDPYGKALFESKPGEAFVQNVTLNYDEIREIREKLNFLKDA
jgi:omega-amidase